MAKKMNFVKLPNGLVDWEATKIPRIDFDFTKDEITALKPKEFNKETSQ